MRSHFKDKRSGKSLLSISNGILKDWAVEFSMVTEVALVEQSNALSLAFHSGCGSPEVSRVSAVLPDLVFSRLALDQFS